MEFYQVGKIVNTHGIRGEVRVKSTTDFNDQRFAPGQILYIVQGKQAPVEVKVKSHRQHKGLDLLVFEGLENINLVEQYKQADLKVSKDQQAELDEGDYYYNQIIGLEVVDQEDGTVYGTIKEILSPGANDVWVVGRRGEDDILLPAIADVIKEVNLDQKQVIVEMMEGLI